MTGNSSNTLKNATIMQLLIQKISLLKNLRSPRKKPRSQGNTRKPPWGKSQAVAALVKTCQLSLLAWG